MDSVFPCHSSVPVLLSLTCPAVLVSRIPETADLQEAGRLIQRLRREGLVWQHVVSDWRRHPRHSHMVVLQFPPCFSHCYTLHLPCFFFVFLICFTTALRALQSLHVLYHSFTLLYLLHFANTVSLSPGLSAKLSAFWVAGFRSSVETQLAARQGRGSAIY